MAKKIKDTDYLAISARVRAMETGLLTRERMEQVLEARSDDEAVKILQECGYPEMDATHPEAMDAALSAARQMIAHRAPAPEAASTIARPMPREPPVTSIRRPAS